LQQRHKATTILGIICLILFLVFPFTSHVHHYLSIPNNIITFENDSLSSIPKWGQNSTVSTAAESAPGTDSVEQAIVHKQGNIPVKKTDLSVLKDKKVIPGGQSIGVQLHTLGVLVVGHHLVNSQEKSVSPGEEADIQVGDVILEMDGTKINKMKDVKPIVHQAGEKQEGINIKLKRGTKTVETVLQPALNKNNRDFQIGLYIRDAASGIGTISFYEEETGKYGALGHTISDSDTKKPIELHKGKLVRSNVTAIEKGNDGIPGEKQAKFSMQDKQLGSITKNSPYGIFGKLKTKELDKNHAKPMSIGLSHEVEKGPAEIWTVLKDEKVEKFDIEIVNTIPQKTPATKGMVIKVTDDKLLETTGGIVQGMSGSPIIQSDKIVGAVTHVFVNDPSSGYGVHIEWMLEEADINIFAKDGKETLKNAG